MRLSTIALACMCLPLMTLPAIAQTKTDAKPKERQIVDSATTAYEEDVAAAAKLYADALAKAKKKMLASYDSAISVAMKRGGGDGLDLANKLNIEKKAFAPKEAKPVAEAEPTAKFEQPKGRDEFVYFLNKQTWYWHWEQANKDRPFTFDIDAKPKDGEKQVWKVDMRWTVSDGSHIFMLTDGRTLRGFNIPTGRQTGAFCEPK